MGLDLFHVVLTDKPQSEYFTIDNFESAPAFLEKNRHFFFNVNDPDKGATLAAWFNEIGYQRKGMTLDFFEQFENCKLYFDSASVRKAAQHLEISPDRAELPQSFLKDFVENFIEGESIFFASF